MDLSGFVEATNNKKKEQEKSNINLNEIYASLVFIQNTIQSIKTQNIEQNQNYTESSQKLNLKINTALSDLQKSISAVPVQTQILTINEVKEIIKNVQAIEKSTLNVCNELKSTREDVKEAIMALKFIILITPVTLVLILICYHWFLY